MNYTYKQIWLINLPVMMSVLMEQLINITDAVFLAMSVKWNLAHLLGRNILSGNLYARLRFQHRTTSHDCPQEWRTELCRNRTYLLSRTIFPFRTSTLFMFVDTGPFPLPLETINYLTGNLSGCNGLSGLAQFRTFIFISLSGTPGFLCGNNKDQVLILGRNSSRTYQHPFQLPVNIYLKIWDSRIGNSLNASRNGIVNHSPYPYVEKDW